MENFNGYFHETTFIDQEGHLRTSKVPVVQELVRQGLNQISERFICVDPNEPSTDTSSNHIPIPSVNVAKLRAGFEPEGRALELAKLANGASEWGMLLIVEHGISSCVLNGVRDVVKGFFGLSIEEKKECVGSYSGADNLGYGRNFVKSDDQKLDWIDRLAMKAAPKGADCGLNVWPQKPLNFRQAIEKYVAEAINVMDELLQALAEAFSLERHVFLKNCDPNDSEIKVRISYYPPCPRPDLAIGITPHTDANGLTLLMQFEANDGLQVLREHNNWVTVQWPSDALIVNAGDLMEIISNGRVKSPWHRAVTQKERERFSVALFYNPPPRAEIVPVKNEEESCNGEGYKKVLVEEYIKHLYEVSPTRLKQTTLYHN